MSTNIVEYDHHHHGFGVFAGNQPGGLSSLCQWALQLRYSPGTAPPHVTILLTQGRDTQEHH